MATLSNIRVTLISIALYIPFYIMLAVTGLLIAVIFGTYRKFVTFIAYLIDPHMGPALSGIQHAQLRDFATLQEKAEICQVACLRFKGPLNFKKMQDLFHRRVIIRLLKTKAFPTLEYPELQKYFVKIMGYIFMKKDEHFEINDHFRMYEHTYKNGVSRRELGKIWEGLIVKPFPKNKSPWEIVIVDNYIPDEEELQEWINSGVGATPSPGGHDNHFWVAFVRMHHALGDGFSIQKMLSHMSETEYVPYFPIKLTSLQRFMWNVKAIVFGPYDILHRTLTQLEPFHALHHPYSKHARECYVVQSKMVKAERVSRLKRKFQVPYTVILVAAIAGGLRKFFLKHGNPLPRSISTSIPVAVANHSDNLTNEYSLAVIPYPVQLETPKERVAEAKRQMELIRDSTWLKMVEVLINAYAILPNAWLQRATERCMYYSSTYSTMPGPANILQTFDSTLMEVTYAYGTSPDTSGYGVSSLTYNGHFRFVFFVDKNTVESLQTAEEIVNLIYEELNVLEKCDTKSNGQAPTRTLEEKKRVDAIHLD